MYQEMTVYGFALDSLTNRPVVILKNMNEDMTLPVWISSMEAVFIAAELINRDVSAQSGREDLLTVLLKQTGMKMVNIVIDGLNDGMFNASINFSRRGKELKVDVRSCEAFIASLKFKLPVLVADEVVARASMLALSEENLARENNSRRFVDFLENLDPQRLGKYPM